MNKSKMYSRQVVYLAKRFSKRTVYYWHIQDRRYGLWWRMANGLLAAVILASIAIPVVQQLYQSERYHLSNAAVSLTGTTDATLLKQLTYDANKQQYQFNKAGVTDSSLPSKLQKASVGTPGNKVSTTYALDIPQDFSKGVTYHDTNSQLSFSLIPQFNAMQGKQVDGHLVYPLDAGNQAIYTLKNNGLKEDIVVPKTTKNTIVLSYKLNLPDSLQAKVIPDSGGAIGIYSADPSLFGDISYGSSTDQAAVEKARKNSPKNYLVFGLPAPVIKAADNGSLGRASARFVLQGTSLSVVAENLLSTHAPITIDPSVLVTSTTDFQTAGNNESNIDFSTAGQINRGGLTGGSATAANWTAGTPITAVSQATAVVYNGYIYLVGGLNGSTVAVNTVQYASLSGGVIGTWASTTGFTTARYGAGVVAYNGYMYVLGGTTNGSTYRADVQYAQLTSTGTIATDSGCGSAWCTTASFNTARANFGTAVYNDYLYIYGGTTNGTAAATDAQFTPINTDGSISTGAWHYTHNSTDDNTTVTSSLSGTGRYSFGSTMYNGFLYMAGGRDAGTIYNDVQYAPINANGTIGTWATTTSFGTTRYLLGAVATNGYLYVAGGFTGSIYKNDVQYAPINANGTIGTWATTTALTVTRYSPGLAANGGYLYSAGGYNGTPQTTTYYIKIDAAGQTSAFSNLASSWVSADYRSLSCAVAYNGYLYAIGGSTSDNNSNNQVTVQSTAINADGTLQSWSPATSLPARRGSTGCAASNGYLYVIGGYTAIGVGAGIGDGAILYTTISSSGALGGTWTANTTSMTNLNSTYTPISPGVFVYAGYIYSVGGASSSGAGSSAAQGVYYAPVNSNGSIGTWVAAGQLVGNYSARGFARVGKYLYAIGGTNGSSPQTAVEYALINTNGSLGSWQLTGSLPGAIAFNFATTMNGCIYTLGGSSGGASQTTTYYGCPAADGTLTSVATDTNGWQTAPPLLTATADMGVTAYNGFIYGVGGYTSVVIGTTEYAAVNNGGRGVTGTWAATSSFTTARYGQSSVVYNGYLYVLGGRSSTGALTPQADVQYAQLTSTGTIATDSGCGSAWCTTTSFTTARYYQASVVYKGYLYVLGGYDGTYYNDVQYAQLTSTGTIATDSGCGSAWCTTTSFTTARFSHTAVVYNGYLYVVGGYSGSYKNDVQYAQLTSTGTIATDSGCGSAWCTTTSFTTARDHHTSVIYNGYLYVIGGYSGSELNDVQYAPVATNGPVGTWATTTSFATPRDSHSSAVYNGYLYIMGGTNGAVQGDTQYAAINSNGTLGTWATTTSFTNRSAASAVIANGYAYVLGGINGSGTTLNDVQNSPLTVMTRTARYSKLVDLSTSASVNSLTYSSTTVPPSAVSITVRPAGTSLLNFGAAINSTMIGNAAATATCAQVGISDTRYLLVTVTLDDSQTGVFSDASNPVANLTDFTVNYGSIHAQPNIRLRSGQTLQNGNISGLDVCGP